MCCPGRPRAFDAVLSSRVRDAEGGAAALEGPRAGCGVLGPGGVGRPRKRAAARLRRPGGFPTGRDEPSWRGACSARPERPAGSLSGPLRRCPQGGGCRRSRAGCRIVPGRGRGGAAVAGLLRGDARRAAGAAVPKPGQGPAPPGREAPLAARKLRAGPETARRAEHPAKEATPTRRRPQDSGAPAPSPVRGAVRAPGRPGRDRSPIRRRRRGPRRPAGRRAARGAGPPWTHRRRSPRSRAGPGHRGRPLRPRYRRPASSAGPWTP